MRRPPHLGILFLLTLLPSCSSASHPPAQGHGDGATADFGRPAVVARTEGEARMLQGRKPIWIKVDPQTLGSRSFTVGMEDIPPGDSIGVHKHMTEDEIVFIYRGAVQVTLGDSSHRALAGGLVFIPRGTWIGFHTTGADTATIVFMFNTPGFEKCLRFLSSPVGRPFVPAPPAEVAAARKECHQVRRVDEARR
jgi:quercetin dioxygenase-like cupin family protein